MTTARSSTSGNERWRLGGTRKFCRCVVFRIELKPWPGARGGNFSFSPPGMTPSIASRLRWKSSLVGLKTTKWRPAAGPSPIRSRFGSHAPEERVVERVEVGALRDRSPLRVERPVRAPDVLLQARGRLERRAVADRSETVVVATHLALRRDAVRRLRNGLRSRPHRQPRPEGRVHAVAEVEVEVPGLEVLEDVGEVHVRAAVEVRARPEVDEPERLEVDDSPRAERVPLRRREAEEELRAVGNEVGARDSRGRRHLFRQPLAPVHLAGEALADARHGERAFHSVGDLGRGRPDVLLVVAAEEERDVVLLEQRVVGIAREADRVEQRSLAAPGGRTGRCTSAASGTCVWKYGRPQATVSPSPSGVAG